MTIKKTAVTIALTGLVFFSCKDKNTAQEEKNTTQTEQVSNEGQVTQSLTDGEGRMLKMTFNNATNQAYLVFHDEKITLESQRPASGIWYRNDHYELSGKGQNIELKKDGEVIFTNNY